MPVIDDQDWRLQGQKRYLQGGVLVGLRYSPPRPNWDHDDCEFCGVKFAALAVPDALTEGFATPDRYRWICLTCFDDFRERFAWSLTDADS